MYFPTSNIMPNTAPLLIASDVLLPYSLTGSAGSTSGSRPVCSCTAFRRMTRPGDILPPMNLPSDDTKSTVTAVPKSKIRQSSPGKSSAAPRAAAILSAPSVRGVSYSISNGIGVDGPSIISLRHEAVSPVSRVGSSAATEETHMTSTYSRTFSSFTALISSARASRRTLRIELPSETASLQQEEFPISISRFFTDNAFMAGKDNYNFCIRLYAPSIVFTFFTVIYSLSLFSLSMYLDGSRCWIFLMISENLLLR